MGNLDAATSVCALTTLETRLSTSCNGLGSEVQTKDDLGS